MLTTEIESGLANLTDRIVTKKYLDDGIKTNTELENFLFSLREPIISTKVICNNKDHIAPIELLRDVILNQVFNFLVWANRSGSKSYIAGLLAWYKSGHYPFHETCILGGSESQSEKSYKAMNDFWRISDLDLRILKSEPMITKTLWQNNSLVSILTASQKSVRSPHPQFLIGDEIDEMEFEIFEAALSQPQSKYGIPASIGLFSTNHNVGGTMDKALEIAKNGGYKLYKYCIWECLESCKDYNCSTCELHSICPGKQMKEANGYYKIIDFISKLQQLSFDTLQTEWLCNKIGRGDLVYQNEWNEDIHLVNVPFNKIEPVILSIDWGGVDPFSIGVWQHQEGLGWVRVDEIYMGNTSNPFVIKEAKSRPWWKNILEMVADPSRADLIKEWQDEGISVTGANNAIDEGIEATKGALKPVLGNPKFFVNRSCIAYRREVMMYKIKNGKPVDKDNHTQDETRYFVMHKIKNLTDGEIQMADWDIRGGR